MAQETIIKPLRDPGTGKQVYPIGYTGAVYNKDGLSVDSLIDTLKTSISNAEQSIKNNKSAIDLLQGLQDLQGSNFLGIQDTTANAQQLCITKNYEIGWALIGTDISSLTAYRITPSSAEQIGDNTYDFTDFYNIKSKLDTLYEKTVDIDEQNHILIYKGVKYLIIGIDDGSTTSNMVAIMGEAIMGTSTTMGAK